MIIILSLLSLPSLPFSTLITHSSQLTAHTDTIVTIVTKVTTVTTDGFWVMCNFISFTTIKKARHHEGNVLMFLNAPKGKRFQKHYFTINLRVVLKLSL